MIKKSFKAIRENKKMFFFVFIIALVVFIIGASLYVHYYSRILLNSALISDKISSMTPEQLLSGQEDALLLNESYSSLKKDSFLLLSFLSLTYLIGIGFLFGYSNKLFFKFNIFKYVLDFVIVSLIYLVPLSFMLFFVVKYLFLLFPYVSIAIVLLFSFIVKYFMLLSYSFIAKNKLFDSIKKSFKLGIKKWKTVLLNYLYLLGLFIIVFILMYVSYIFFLDWLVIVSILLFCLMIAYSAVHVISVAKSL